MMKKKSGISKILGVTHNDMAMLLNISRSQWSMYESGKRDLPLSSKLLLTEILTYVKTPSAKSQNQMLHITKQDSLMKASIQRQLQENEFQQLLAARQTVILEQKQEKSVRKLLLVSYLSNNDHKNNDLLKVMEAKAIKQLENSSQLLILQHKIKQATLQLEHEMLLKALKEEH